MFVFFNDTGREVRIHPATENYCDCDTGIIQPLEEREFKYLVGERGEVRVPWVKLWDYGGEDGLVLLVKYKVEG